MANFEEISVPLSDGYQAYARYWRPRNEGGPRGAVLYHHGIQSHCGWYETSPARLAEAGHAVLQVDRRGSGRNQQDRGHAESAEQLIGDALAARDELARRSGLTGHHVIGVSWGGKLAVATYVSDPIGVKSLSLVTPGLFPLVGVSRQQMAKIGFAMIYEPRRLFDIPLNDAELFTAVPRWQDFFNSDPLLLRQCSASFYLASRRMDKIIAKFPKARPVPVHLLVAGDERIIDSDKTTNFIRGLDWPNCRITTYDNARHSLEFEDDPDVYFKDLVSFIEEAT
ncbi:MAG: alpha/beta fold hydrolase [Phycisphaerae bacterium]